MKKRVLAMLLSTMMLVPLMACNNDTYLDDSQISLDEQNTESEIIEYDFAERDSVAIMDFAVHLLQTEGGLVRYNSNGGMNRLLSPFSVLTAMTMTANGAKSETREQMEEVLGGSIEDLNVYLSNYKKNLSQEKDTRFHLANSIWFTEDDSFTVKKEFLDLNKKYYGADIYETTFNQNAVKEINKWVEDNTDGLIKEIINEIPQDAVMYLINALVFDAKWEKSYEEPDIQEGIFTTFDGIEQEVDMMYSNENCYLEDENVTGFMKYYKGRDYAFVALLPKTGLELGEYIDSLSGEKLCALLLNAKEIKTHAWLPQFEVSYEAELSETLEAMGMRNLFDGEKSDLSDMGTYSYGNLYVDRVLHKTYIEVTPVGTKAGAATAVEVRNECALLEPDEVKEVRLDRPFLYMIIDCENNLPIFIGTINYIQPYRCGVIDDLCGYPLAE